MSAGRNKFVIDSNGDVYGCKLLTDNKFKERNVKKENFLNFGKKFCNFQKKRLQIEMCDTHVLRSMKINVLQDHIYSMEQFYKRSIIIGAPGGV